MSGLLFAAPSHGNMSPEKILIIDDNMNDVQLMRRILERAGYQTFYANSGEHGLTMVGEILPDCVVVDYRMPGMDGFEVSRRLKSDVISQNIPVLMLTGADSPKNIVQGLEAGADDFVTKSSDLDVILARVRALLRVKAYQDQIRAQSAQLQEKSDRIMALNQRLNRDLQFARRVQEALLPSREFHASGVEIRSAYMPSETLSGDFYDYFTAGETLYLFMGDVSGHGLPAAILVAILKSFLHSETDPAVSLADFMSSLNDFLHSASLPSQYATGQVFRFTKGDSHLSYSSAAHPPFLVLNKAQRQVTLVERPGHLLGANPGAIFEQHELDVAPGDTLFVYTDGLTDRKSVTGDFYSIDRIAEILESNADRPLPEVYDAVYRDAAGFSATEEYKDDIAFVLARFQ